MLKLLQLLIVTLLVISIFSISSANIIEKSSQTLTEKSIEGGSLEQESPDKFLNEHLPCKFTYFKKVYTSFSIHSTKKYEYTHDLLRPPIFS